jgi:PAS domain S-box-containing protein
MILYVTIPLLLLVLLAAFLFNRRNRGQSRKNLMYRYALETVNDGVWTWDVKKGQLTLSPRCYTMLGYEAEEFPSTIEEWLSRVHEDDRERGWGQVVEQARRGSYRFAVEFRIRAKDGSWRWIESRGDAVERDRKGDVSLVVGLHSDVTERREYEEQLEEREEQYRLLFDEMINPASVQEVVYKDHGPVDFRYLDVNPAWERMTGILREEALGKGSRELFGDTYMAWLDDIHLVASTGVPRHRIDYIAALNKYLETNLYSPRPGVAAGTFVDITERKRSEEQLKHRLDAVTAPSGDLMNLTLPDLFDLEELQEMQESFASANGVASVILDLEGNPLTRPSRFSLFCRNVAGCDLMQVKSCLGLEKEEQSDLSEGPVIGSCHVPGMMSGAAPIIVGGRHIATWIIGQVRDRDFSPEDLLAFLEGDPGREKVDSLRSMDRNTFRALCQTLFLIARQLSKLALRNLQQAQAIAARQQAEENLAFAQFVIDRVSDQVWYLNRDGEILFVNEAGVRATGYDREELLGMKVNRINTFFEGKRMEWNRFWERLRQETSIIYEGDHVRKDGSTYPVEVSANYIRYGGNEIDCAFVRDITERRRAEVALRRKNEELEAAIEELTATNDEFETMNEELVESRNELIESRGVLRKTRNYLDSIINSLNSLIIGIDEEGNVTHWNRKTEEFTGVKHVEALGEPVVSFFPDLADISPDILEAVQKREPYRKEKMSLVRDDARYYYDLAVFPIEGEETGGAVIRVDDVTEKVQLEEMMVQSEKMMSVGGLAAGMAHEINNPLGIILQGVQSVERRLSNRVEANREEASEAGVDLENLQIYLEKRNIDTYLKAMEEAGKRAAHIVRNMLNFSRRSSKAMEETNINSLIDRTLELARSDYDLKKHYDFKYIDIHRDYDRELPPVFCSATEIEQVFLNILRNSAQALYDYRRDDPSYQPEIRITTRLEDEYAVIQLEDNGPGMDEDTRRRAFEPFFTTKSPGIGTGLGLSVSYFIITSNHGGRIELQSEKGRGSQFTIYLPLLQERNKAAG